MIEDKGNKRTKLRYDEVKVDEGRDPTTKNGLESVFVLQPTFTAGRHVQCSERSYQMYGSKTCDGKLRSSSVEGQFKHRATKETHQEMMFPENLISIHTRTRTHAHAHTHTHTHTLQAKNGLFSLYFSLLYFLSCLLPIPLYMYIKQAIEQEIDVFSM